VEPILGSLYAEVLFSFGERSFGLSMGISAGLLMNSKTLLAAQITSLTLPMFKPKNKALVYKESYKTIILVLR
jgi:hypothetical protein